MNKNICQKGMNLTRIILKYKKNLKNEKSKQNRNLIIEKRLKEIDGKAEFQTVSFLFYRLYRRFSSWHEIC